MRVRGQIGVYGRSIGGIAASYLVNKFPGVIKVFIGDRTMGNFENIVANRYLAGSRHMVRLYRMLSCKWRANNVEGFLENSKCYKIHCFDENDDVVDIFSSHHHEVAKQHCSINYETLDWKKFYESLITLFEIEDELYQSVRHLTSQERREITKHSRTHVVS